MKIYETYSVLGHKVDIEMSSLALSLQDFSCVIKVDNQKGIVSNCSFNKGETLNPEKVLIEKIEESLSYAKSPNIGKFIHDNKFGGSEQEINAGDIVFRAARISHEWLMNAFSQEEIKELYKAVEPDLNVDSISKEAFIKYNVFSSYTPQEEIECLFEKSVFDNKEQEGANTQEEDCDDIER